MKRTRARAARRMFRCLSTPTFVVLLVFVSLAGRWPAGGRALAQNGTPATTPSAGSGLAAAVAWLVEQQTEDGGFPGLDGTSDPGTTCDAIYALAAAREAGLDVTDWLDRAFEFLAANALVYAQTGAGQSAKLVLAAVAAGADPREVDGVLPLELVVRGVDPATGLYGAGVFNHALAILALVAAGEETPDAAFDALAATQLADGSWAFDGATAEGGGDSNSTALVVQALVAAGQGDGPLVRPAIAYLGTVQVEGGGFGYQAGEPTRPDANSTALAVQALIAVGLGPSAPDLLDAAGALAAFQNPSGAFRYADDAPDDNLFATVQAIPALAGLSLPIVPDDGSVPTPGA